jgi:putative SOS response-associated peptidase YedK
MCNLYTLQSSLADIAAAFSGTLGRTLYLAAGPDTLANQPWRTSVWPKYQGLFVRAADPADPAGDLEPAVGRWGLVPAHHKGPARTWPRSTNNCRSETMWTLPAFKDSLAARRCIIPADNFVEHTGPKGSMTKHRISMADGSLLFLAGLWAGHAHEGEVTESYTMVMQDARPGDDMRPFHDRQPVFLNRESAAVWLDPRERYAPLLTSPPKGTLAFDPPEPVAA